MENTSVKIKLTEEDFRNWHLTRVFSTRFKIINVIIILLMAATLIISLMSGKSFWSFIKSFLPVIVFYGIYLILMPVLVYFNVKKIFESDRIIQEEQVYEFNGEGFTVTTSYGKSFTGWDKIFSASADKNNISFFTSRIRAFLLPKKYFTSEAQIEALLAAMREKIEKKKLKIR
ncbi:MAG: YcxB family protein [Candidatus Goldiibacteriota bacterium]